MHGETRSGDWAGWSGAIPTLSCEVW
jgi:hypothetical protein